MDDLRKVKIGFFGTPTFSLRILKALNSSFANIKYVVTQAPKPAGRGKSIKFSEVHQWSKNANEYETTMRSMSMVMSRLMISTVMSRLKKKTNC